MSKKYKLSEKPVETHQIATSTTSFRNLQNNTWLLLGILLVFALVAFHAILQNDFVPFDDDESIWLNPNIKNPTFRGIFVEPLVGMYVPITQLFYLATSKIFGEKAFGFHFISLLLHLVNIGLVFYLFRQLQSQIWVAFGVTMLFAVHPIQTETVAWISAQSSLLYVLFYLLTLIFWLKWQKTPTTKYYAWAIFTFLLAATSKSSAITAPILLIVLDFYKQKKLNWGMIWNKAPFLVLSFALGLYTFVTRATAGHTLNADPNKYNFWDRILMVCQSILFYPIKILAPIGYSIFYPFVKNGTSWSWDFYIAPILIVILGWFLWEKVKNNQDWAWAVGLYILPLAIMLPYVSVGSFEMKNDRYMYLSGLGLYYGLTFLVEKLEDKMRFFLFIAIGVFMTFLSFKQVKVWKNGDTLFTNCIEKNPKAALCHCNLGYSELLASDFENCVKHYTEALRLDTTFFESYNGRGQALMELKRFNEAQSDFENGIKAGINSPKIHLNLGKCKVIQNHSESAMPDLLKSISLDPNIAETYYFKAIVEGKANNPDAALQSYTMAINLKPTYIEALVNRGYIHSNAQRYTEAINDYNQALQANPNVAFALNNRASAYMMQGNLQKALEDANKSLQLQPNYTKAVETRDKILKLMGN
jgi:protein O-mannosyl-transferase